MTGYKQLHICFYISDHGFGHAMRCVPIMQELLARGAKITAVCGERQIASIGDCIKSENLFCRSDKTDIGLVLQRGTLLVDNNRLYAATKEYLSQFKGRAEREAEWLIENRVDIAVCDMPLYSIDACRLAGVPMQYIGNFTWAELYREHLPDEIWQAYANEYKLIKHALLYNPHNAEMLEFLSDAEIKETSLVARKFHSDKAAAIKAKHKNPLVFVALGMSAEFIEPVDVSALPYDFITNQGISLVGKNVWQIPSGTEDTQDYILASDYVITKAGWGTIAECILAKKKMALFERDSVLEDRVTIQKLEEQKLAVKILQDDLKDIENIIIRMNTQLKADGFALYYDAVTEIADNIFSLAKEII